jgi:hypothetical protein
MTDPAPTWTRNHQGHPWSGPRAWSRRSRGRGQGPTAASTGQLRRRTVRVDRASREHHLILIFGERHLRGVLGGVRCTTTSIGMDIVSRAGITTPYGVAGVGPRVWENRDLAHGVGEAMRALSATAPVRQRRTRSPGEGWRLPALGLSLQRDVLRVRHRRRPPGRHPQRLRMHLRRRGRFEREALQKR